MTLKRTIIVSVSALLILAVGIFIFFGGYNMRPHRALDRFAGLIEEGDLDDIRMVIYFNEMSYFVRTAWSVDRILGGRYDLRIVVEGDDLIPHLDLLRSINSDILIPAEERGRVDARIYLLFEDSRGRKIFDVVMWTSWTDFTILINDRPFERIEVFYDIILAVLPEDHARNFRWSFGRDSN